MVAVAVFILLIGLAVAYRISTDSNSDVDIGIGSNGVDVKVKRPAGNAGDSEIQKDVKHTGDNNVAKTLQGGGAGSSTVNKPGATFPKLTYPQGYIYYSITVEDVPTRDGSLARIANDEYPSAEEISVGDMLQSTNTKTLRTRPFGAASGKEVPRDTCFRVLAGDRKKIIAPAPVKSAAWIPAEQTNCPAG